MSSGFMLERGASQGGKDLFFILGNQVTNSFANHSM